MVIRREQERQFETSGSKRLLETLIGQVRESWRAECDRFGDARVALIVGEAAERAFAWEFSTEYDVARYVHLVFAFENADFASEDWAQVILQDRSLPSRIRMNLLWDAARDDIRKRSLVR